MLDLGELHDTPVEVRTALGDWLPAVAHSYGTGSTGNHRWAAVVVSTLHEDGSVGWDHLNWPQADVRLPERDPNEQE